MKKILKISLLALVISTAGGSFAQTTPPTSACPNLEKLVANPPEMKDCSVVTDARRKCKCEARNARKASKYDLRKLQAQQSCDNKATRTTIKATYDAAIAACPI